MALLPYIVFALIAPCSAQTAASASTRYREIVVTRILLPSALFSPAPSKQNFTAYYSSSSSTTFYYLYPDYRDNATGFLPTSIKNYAWSGYPFSASAAGAQYIWQNLTINCPSATPIGTATCTTTSTNLDNTNPPSYHTVAESSFYKVLLYDHNTTAQAPSPTPTFLKIGVGLGAPLAICLCVLVALLILRHRAHKQLSRLKHTRVVAASVRQAVGRDDTKLEPLVPGAEAGAMGFKAWNGGMAGGMGDDGAGRGFGVRASEVSGFSNELDGLARVGGGRKELA